MPWSSSNILLHASLLLGTLMSGHSSSSCTFPSTTRGRIPSSPPPSSCPLATDSLSSWLPGRRLNPRRELWSFTSNDSIAASPILSHDGGVIYIGSNDDNLYAVSAKNGSLLWKYTTGDWVYGRPALSPDGGAVYFGSDDFKVYALDASSGRELWTFKTGGYASANPTLSPTGDVLYIGSYDKYFYAIRASDGTLVWKYLMGEATDSGAILSRTGQTLYFGAQDNKTHALSAADGSLRWTFQTGGNVYATPLLSRSGDMVYVASLDHTVYALDAETGKERFRFTTGGRVWSSPVLDPIREVVYVGSDDNRLYAINASTGGEVWGFEAGSWVQSTAVVSSDGGTVFFGSADHRLYALSAETGSMRWSVLTGSDVYSSPVLSPDGLVVYVGSNDNKLYAFDARDLPTGWQPDTGLPYLLAVGALAMMTLLLGPCIMARARQYRDPQGNRDNNAVPSSKAVTAHRLLCFTVAGIIYGLALSAPTAFVFLVLRSRMTFAHGSNYPRDWLQMERHPFFSTAVFAGIISTALLWAAFVILAASRRRTSTLEGEGEGKDDASNRALANLPAACTLFALLSSLVISFNLVPGLYLTHIGPYKHGLNPQVTSFMGSRPRIFSTWLFCSYPSGLALLFLQLCVLEALLTCVEAIDGMHCQAPRPWRYWRGHFSRRWVVALPSYNWGFAGYWVSTAVVMYLFNHHQGHVPPFTPLSLIGLGAGLTSYLTRLLFVCPPPTSPSDDPYDWTKARVLDIVAYLSWSPTGADRDLRKTWRAQSHPFLHHVLGPKKLLGLVVNAWCPDAGGMRRRVGRWTGVRLSSLGGSQANLKDELDWAFITFSISSMSAVMPLIMYWLYTRFLGDARTLDIQPPYQVVTMTPNALPTFNNTPPIHLQPSQTPSFTPLQYSDSGASPFHRCQWEDAATSADPGDFNICLDRGWASCLHIGSCVFPACTGLATQIQAEPSESLWFQMQLVVYAGFLLFCFWTITWERDQNLCVSVALRLNGIFEEDQEVRGKRSWQWWQKNVIAPIILVGLGALYSACLMLDRVEERFVIFRSYITLNDASNRKVRAMLSDPSPVLAWFCEKLHEGLYAARVVYSFSASDTPEICLVQGALFAYGCYALLASHTRVYNFLDADMLMTAQQQDGDGSDDDVPPYMLILKSRESGLHIMRRDVNEFLHRQVYRPFLLTVRTERPELLSRLFNQDEARLIERIIEQETTSPQERAGRPPSPPSPPECKEERLGGSSRGAPAIVAPGL